ncbi:MAG: tetratricopeptide TPR_4 [uncultured bacterium]|nr:MAG: tetratricopeptide TPR_4 [uncultured bacterium]
MKKKLAFAFILLSAFLIRVFGINWDQGFHLHPDERMLIMVAEKVNFFNNLNPDFFNYGSLPIYLLKGLSQLIDLIFGKNLSNYAGMLTVGRSLSVFFDLITICLIYKIGQLLFKVNKIALFSGLLYAIAFFPIQNSHFFVVDVFLNTLITGLAYILISYFKSPSIKKIIVFSIVFAAMMATKFTAIIFFPIIFFVIILKNVSFWKKIIIQSLVFGFWFLVFYFAFMPYAFIEQTKFISDIKAQLKMNSDPYIFPYTLQYVSTLPYLYYLKNIFLWGLGPVISTLTVIGLFYLSLSSSDLIGRSRNMDSRLRGNDREKIILFLIFYFLYFIVIGRSAVKFMRYMLPLYPFFVLLAGYGLYKLYEFYKLLAYALIACALVWSLMFLNIYSFPHTRIAATDWILKNIPDKSTLAVEHWDDRVPIYGGEKYNYEEMTLYEQPDNEIKWKVLNEKLIKSDYIIIASNRLYIPLQRLNDCKKYKSCYPLTSQYYQKLFSEILGFKKVSEFSAYPGFGISNFKFQINDDSADESFTVYDHPKIIIFKKND